jgi:nicotinate phosphoribosyltransferase
MAYAEWKAGRHNEHCIFEMFLRKCPFNGKYAIFTGHDEVFEFLKTYKFS